MPVQKGDLAPDFSLKDENNNMVSLSDFRGKKVVLYFYPKDDTPGCTKEACSFRDGFSELQKAGIEILGVSYDSPQSHRKFIDKYNLPFRLLSDIDKKVARMYGAAGPLWGKFSPKRYTYLINESGNIIHIFQKVDVEKHAQEVLEVYISAENDSSSLHPVK